MNQRVQSFHRRWIFLATVVVGIGIGAFTAQTGLTQEQGAEDLGASLRSDKAAYTAGETATLTGEGFQGLEPIQLDISIDEPVTGTHVADSTSTPFAADANGGFIAEYVVPTAADGMMVRATAVGGSSGLSARTILKNPAWVTTDLDDYPPGGLVTITGGGFLANETVELQVLHVGYVDSDGTHYQGPLDTQGEGFDTWIVQADEHGDLVEATWYVCQDLCVNALLELTATGLTSGLTAQRRFTDERIFAATISPASAFTSVQETYTITVTNTSTKDSDILSAIQVAIPAGAGTPSGISVAAMNSEPTALNWTVVPSPPAGTMRFQEATSGDSVARNGTVLIMFTSTATAAGSKVWTTAAYGQTNFSGQPFGTAIPSVNVISCGNGLVDAGEQCDQGAANGTSTSCCSAACTFRGTGQTCRASAGQCDMAETCTGASGVCPADGFASSTKACTGASQGAACDDDAADHCTGTSNDCVDVFRAAGSECRASAGQCDVAETCTGASGACPADGFAATTTTCTGASQGGLCDDDVADHCTGTSNDCIDAFRAAGSECRASAGQCDVAETCTGTSGACPTDAFKPVGVACTDDGNVCTDDRCDGSGACTHPNNTASCSDGNACTSPDVCSGGVCMGGAPVYGFTGFFPPIDSPNTVNVGKAGRTFPVKFQLPLCSGGYVSSLSAVTNIRYQRITCSNFLPQDAMPSDADTSGSSGLRYDASAKQYIFTWQTSASFANNCYELRVDFDNGSFKTALFKFTK